MTHLTHPSTISGCSQVSVGLISKSPQEPDDGRSTIVKSLIAVACLLTHSVARADFISYFNPAKFNGKDAVGNQGYTGSLGMDFRTLDPISITQLGVFDSGLKGIAKGQTLTVAIFDTSTKKEVTPEVTFTNQDPGTLSEGSLFKTLKTPVKFDAGVDLTRRGVGVLG